MLYTYDITRKQKDLLDFLIANQDQFSQPPTLDEICFAMGLKSRGSLHKHIQGLVSAGLIEAPNRKQRGIRLTEYCLSNITDSENRSSTEETNSEMGTPFLGAIAAGTPLKAMPDTNYITIPDEIKTNKPCYILLVKGDSMIDDGIFDGDWVIIEEQSYARNGDCVVALIDKDDVTLKYIEQYPNETILIPANKNMRPMHFQPDQVDIQGVLVGQMRSYK